MGTVAGAKALRDQHVEALSDQLLAPVPEQGVGLCVDELDLSVGPDGDDRVRRAIEEAHVVLGRARQLDLLGHVFEAKNDELDDAGRVQHRRVALPPRPLDAGRVGSALDGHGLRFAIG